MASGLNIVLNIHFITAVLVLIAGFVTLVWGVALAIRLRSKTAVAQSAAGEKIANSGSGSGGLMPRGFRIALSVTAALGLIQALIGVLLVTIFGQHPTDNLHYVYGLIVLGAVPVAYVYSDQKQVRRDVIIMTIAAVAVIGAAVRGIMTGFGLH